MTTAPSLPFNQQVYTMTCANDDGAIRTAVHVSTTAQTSDIPDIIDTLYQRLAARGYHTWLYDHATNTRTDRQGLVDGTTIPVLRDLIDAVEASERTAFDPYSLAMPDEITVSARAYTALLTYVSLIAGIVPEGQLLPEVQLLDDDAIAALLGVPTTEPVWAERERFKGMTAEEVYDALSEVFPASMTDDDMTQRANEILSGGDGPEDEAEWATPADVMDLLAGQPDVPPTEEA